LRQVYIDTLEHLTAALEQAQDNTAAIRYAQRLLQHDPLRAIRAAANGEAIFSPTIARRVMQHFDAPNKPTVFLDLAECEHEVLALLTQGLTTGF
jgi:DNA-binding NarL/FixJ family response regulator